ncbi:MAG: PEP-CTERM sorting domain-containing protein [Planctomycetes bacterium]|nr:PEP-CTERM sorting domain-containing protein [Planctomycetota bacterium]
MAIEADVYFTPPADRSYLLELLYVPEGINGAPEVGTAWEVPLDQTFVVSVPTYRWSPDDPDDPHGYLFAFTITAVPEPASVFGLIVAGMLLHAHRRRRRA